MNANSIMSSNPVTCRSDETTNLAAQRMWDHDIGALPVVDVDNRVVGMITDRDICMAAYTQGRPLTQLPVEAAMSRQVHSVKPNTSLSVAEALMQKHQVRRLPVVHDNGRIVGMLSLNDLASRTSSAKGALVSEREVAQTLRAVSTPRSIETQARMTAVG